MSHNQVRDSFTAYGTVPPGTRVDTSDTGTAHENQKSQSSPAPQQNVPQPLRPTPVWEDTTIPVSKGGRKSENRWGIIRQRFSSGELGKKEQAIHDAYWQDVAATRTKLMAAYQRDLEQADRDEYEQLLVDAIRRTNQRRKYTAVICNLKGGAGKSPLTALFAITLGWVVQRVVTAIDNNPYGGTLAKWLDIHRDKTVSVRQMEKLIEDKRVNAFTDFSAPLGSNEFNVQFVVSDRVAQKMSYGKEIARRVIGKAQVNSIFVVNDTSNDIGAGAVEAALEMSDVLILASLNVDDKLAGVSETMDNFHEWGYDAITKHAVIAIMGLKPGQTAEDYRDELGLKPDATLVGIPFDASLSNYAAIKPTKLSQEARIAALELVLIVSRVARHTQDHGRGEAPLQFTQGKLVELSNGRTPVLSYVSNPSVRQADASASHIKE